MFVFIVYYCRGKTSKFQYFSFPLIYISIYIYRIKKHNTLKNKKNIKKKKKRKKEKSLEIKGQMSQIGG